MTFDHLRSLAKRADDGWHYWPRDNPQDLGFRAPSLEDCDFLYGLVRLLKPKIVVETGTGLGVSGRFIAEALVENGSGWLITFEAWKQYADQARRLLDNLPVEIVVGSCRDHADLDAELVFLDSHEGRRAEEIAYWLTNGYRGPVVVHDALRRYPEFEHGIGAILSSPQGIWVGYPR